MPTLETSRRGFMQLGATSMAVLTMSAGFASLTGCTKSPMPEGYKILRQNDIDFLSALAPVMLSDSYPGNMEPEVAKELLMKSLDRLIGTLQEYARSQLELLLMTMQSGPIRIFADAQWADWKDATTEDVEGFLQGWKHSWIPLKRMGYSSLCKIFAMCWYMNPETFASTGYPGMPKKINLGEQA
ncbi:MAG: hypothetical protein WAO12_09540 [Venatoribacter sp.]